MEFLPYIDKTNKAVADGLWLLDYTNIFKSQQLMDDCSVELLVLTECG